MDNSQKITNRVDHAVILGLIESQSKVLDLGCGDGELLHLLSRQKSVRGTGIEIDENAIYKCIEKGLSVAHGDIDSGLMDYSDKRFDYVILNESLQQVLHPEKVILESLRVGKKVIVGIPNFCQIGARFQLFFQGRVPVTKELPYQWYDTPNLRFLSIKDFANFCKVKNITIEKEVGIDDRGVVGILPNLFANLGIFLLSRN
ncbi:MAG TPA: methionine biosynthesis protein MetW [Candidatus Omnitrophota bacterium]|nr:methionine biosynthesis protein MetW [Candidatus Omnitrophota bacterium]HPD85382.1 methionine biosynthesis protein MetW [Candidatus Omnitrophota bacterium]HRZ04117.1 methionine biosynthesis protein MetW [Candidatus Omnitrophota bacterium]